MVEFLVFILSFMVFPFVAAAAAKLVYEITQRGEILGGWQSVLMRIHPKEKRSFYRKFLYNRLGGCIKCTRQTIGELTFICFVQIWHTYGNLPTYYIGNEPVRWIVNFCLFVAFCGLALTWGQFIETPKKQSNKEDEIISVAKPRKL